MAGIAAEAAPHLALSADQSVDALLPAVEGQLGVGELLDCCLSGGNTVANIDVLFAGIFHLSIQVNGVPDVLIYSLGLLDHREGLGNLPQEEVDPLPDWLLRELDHEVSVFHQIKILLCHL